MPTLVDAFLVTVGLDTSSFVKGQKAGEEAYKKTKDSAVATGKSIEDSSKKAAEGINKITKEVLGLFAVLLGTRSVKDFVSDIMSADAALGRFAYNLQQSPQDISAWQQASQRMGGSAEATAQTFERMGQALYNLHRNGQMMPMEFGQLEAATHKNINLNGTQQDIMLGIADAAHQLAQVDPTRAHFLLSGMGIDDATANVMIKYGAGLKAYLQALKQNAPSDDTIKKMQQLQDQLAALQQTAVSLANVVAAQLEPVLGPLLENLTKWIAANKEVIASDVIAGVKEFAIDANNIANAVGGWKNATELLFALWVGSKFVAVLANVAALGAATTGVAAGISSIFGLLGIAGILGVDAYKNTVKQAGAGEQGVVSREGMLAWANGYQPGYVYDPNTGKYSPPGAGAAGGSTVDMIRKSAIAHGIDPNVALTVAAHEGLNSYVGDSGSSFGPFQLHYGGVAGGALAGSGLGDQFTKATGLDARDKSTLQQQIDFSMDYVSKHGWGSWNGAKAAGIYGMAGVGAATAVGARGAAQLSNVQNNQRVTTSSSSNTVNVGAVNVQTGASDSAGIANDIAPSLRRAINAQLVNSGPE